MNRNMACHPPNPTYTRFIFGHLFKATVSVCIAKSATKCPRTKGINLSKKLIMRLF